GVSCQCGSAGLQPTLGYVAKAGGGARKKFRGRAVRLCVAGIVLTASSCAVTPAKSPKAAQAPVPAVKPAPSADPQTPPANPSVPSFPARPEPQTDAEKKLDGSLLRIARAAKSGGTEQGEAAAKALDLLSEDRKIKIEITMTDKAQVAAMRDAVVARGGSI